MIKYFTIEDLLKHYLQKKFHILLKLDIASEEKEYTILQITFPKGTVHRI